MHAEVFTAARRSKEFGDVPYRDIFPGGLERSCAILLNRIDCCRKLEVAQPKPAMARGMKRSAVVTGIIICLGLAGCVTPLRDTQSTALCIQSALSDSGWATDIKINAPDKSHGWTITFQRCNTDGTTSGQAIGVSYDMVTGQGLYETDDHQTIALLRSKCPGAAYPDPEIVT